MREELKQLRKQILKISNKGKDGNLQSIFSSLEIIWTLYNKAMNWSVEESLSKERDLFILSKGQASLGMGAVLAEKGLFKWKELEGFCSFNGRFSMQLDRTKFLNEGGIESSSGSLGHGFPMAVGAAYANKLIKNPGVIYVLAGDGEMNEGTMWESCLFASSKELNNLCLIIDDNHSIGEMIEIGSLKDKLSAFGFDVHSVNGHNVEALEAVLKNTVGTKPRAVLASTFRGYGAKTLMEKREWFHKAPTDEELVTLLEEVEAFEKVYGQSSI